MGSKVAGAKMMSRSSAVLIFTLLTHLAAGIISSSTGSGSSTLSGSGFSANATSLPSNSGSLRTDAVETTVVDEDELATELERSLRFEPAVLDFGDSCPMGTARVHTVTLVNQNANRSVYLTSISGRTPSFYSSFFEAKVVPPLGNTTFSVVFLPRSQEHVTAELLIHTSFGQARLLVRGVGQKCPYRLKPLVGVKAPMNATLTPEIHMYNPHGTPLQILEVYSSGGQFQLELPSGGQEAPQTLWEIPPYTMKPVIRIRFHARTAGNHTAYIRIKISEQPLGANSAGNNVLVIPVEFEIHAQRGMFTENPIFDFGQLSTTTADGRGKAAAIQAKLRLRSSQPNRQHDVIDFQLPKIPGLRFEPSEAILTLEPHLFTTSRVLDEVLVVRAAPQHNASETNEFTVLIRAEVFKGTLHYDSNATTFVTQDTAKAIIQQKRTLSIRNDFTERLALLEVFVGRNESDILRLRFSDMFMTMIRSEAGGIVLKPGDTLELMDLQLLDASGTFQTALHIRTNITHFEWPIVVCSGRLHVSTYDTARIIADSAYNGELNLGAIPLAEMSHDGYIVLRNDNPLPIKLKTWDFQSPQGVYFHTTFRGCLRQASLRSLRHTPLKLESAKFKLCTQLEKNDVAVFQVAIQSYITEHHIGSLKIWTAYEEIRTTVHFRTWMGKLEVDQEQLYFKNCFPGKRCMAELSIRSTFQHSIRVMNINFTDVGLYFEDFSSNGSVIAPNAVTKIGRIYFEPAQFCQNRCYIPQDGRSNAIAFPAPEQTKGGPNNNLYFDETELRRRTELFRHLKWYFQDIAFTLNSHEVRQFLLQLIIDIEWPKLVVGKQIFPTIEAGKFKEVQVVLHNPADTPVLVDFFLADPQYANRTQISLPLEVVDISPHCYLTDKAVFSLANGTPRHPVLVPPHTNLPITVQFEAHSADTYCTLLHIRNNLTLYEAVWVSAKSVQSQFRFGNRKPGSSMPLLFEVSEKHLTDCAQRSSHQSSMEAATGAAKYTQLVAKRTFTARNTGEIPIWVDTFLIGGQPCAGYGFKVLDCSSFDLKANDSKKIEIAFSPDFTASRISRPLTLRTNLSYEVTYLLVAQLPAISLDKCAALLPRPVWEERIRNAAIVILATMFIFVLIAAHIDYGNILISQSALYLARDKGPIHPTFNLRNIALKAAQQHASGEVQQSNLSSVPTTTTTQRRQFLQQKGGNGTNLKRKSLKRNSNSNGIATAASSNPKGSSGGGGAMSNLPWSLDLSALKCTSMEDGTKKGCSEGSNLTPTNSTARTAINDKEPQLNSNLGASTKKQQQQPLHVRSTKKSKSLGTSEKVSPTTIGVLEKFEKMVAGIQQKTANTGGKNTITKAESKPDTLSNGNSPNVKTCTADAVPTFSPTAVKTVNDVVGGGRLGKCGKTPGRERRKEKETQLTGGRSSTHSSHEASQSTSSSASCSSSSSSNSNNSKRSERKQRLKQIPSGHALPFGLSPKMNSANVSRADDLVAISSANSSWEGASSQVSFSDILQTTATVSKNQHSSQAYTNMFHSKEAIAGNFGVLFGLENENDTHHSLLDGDAYKRSTAASEEDVKVENVSSNSSELGPIGSRKSPLSTPVWEPINNHATIHGLQMPKPTLAPQSCSYFSNVQPASNYDTTQLRGAGMTLFDQDGKLLTENYPWYMYMQQRMETLPPNMLQAYYDGMDMSSYNGDKLADERTRFMCTRQQSEVPAHVPAHQNVEWVRPSSCIWSPTTAYLGQAGVSSDASAMPPTGERPIGTMASANAGGGGPWQMSAVGSAVMRPPPGLEVSFQDVNSSRNMLRDVSAEQLPHRQQERESIEPPEMQPYDPFSSLSVIWSDNWEKRNNNNSTN